jgi:polyhydroxybutyrate depolymerase
MTLSDTMRGSILFWACLLVVLVGCGSSASNAGGAGGDAGGGGGGAGGVAGSGGAEIFDCDVSEPVNCPEVPPLTIDVVRPAQVRVPSDYTTATRYPLVLVLHARGTTADETAVYLGATQRVDELEFVLVMPDGTEDTEGRLAWNAGASDSVFEPEAPDDVAYVLGLIAEAKRTYRLDASRIYLMGSSNGAELEIDILCDDPTHITAAVSQAGALPSDAICADGPTSLLSVHGTADEVVAFGGGEQASGITILSAVDLVAGVGERSGCDPFQMLSNLDLVPMPPGAETRVRSYSNCNGQAESGLWAVQQAPHVPDFTDNARDLWFDWLFAR